eukprot:m.1659413 g.1659413  ORF g.1659413 m.1659413 type:complete len:65 (+) comp118858_c0_seq1:37-231(+)
MVKMFLYASDRKISLHDVVFKAHAPAPPQQNSVLPLCQDSTNGPARHPHTAFTSNGPSTLHPLP